MGNTLHMHPHPDVVGRLGEIHVQRRLLCAASHSFRNLGHVRLCHCRVVVEERALGRCPEMCNCAKMFRLRAKKILNMNSFVSLSCERFSVQTHLELAVFLAFGLFDTGQFWPLFAQVSRPVWFGSTMLQGGTSELMQAKLVRLLSQTLYWFNVFTVQLDYAAASAPRLGADTRVAQATAGRNSARKCRSSYRSPTSIRYSLHVVGELWLLVLCENKIFTWSTSHVIW